MGTRRIITITLCAIMGGYLGWLFAGLQGMVIASLLGVVVGFIITTEIFLESERRNRQRREEEREFRRRAYHTEIGRQKAIGDYEGERRSQSIRREQLKKIGENFGKF